MLWGSLRPFDGIALGHLRHTADNALPAKPVFAQTTTWVAGTVSLHKTEIVSMNEAIVMQSPACLYQLVDRLHFNAELRWPFLPVGTNVLETDRALRNLRNLRFRIRPQDWHA